MAQRGRQSYVDHLLDQPEVHEIIRLLLVAYQEKYPERVPDLLVMLSNLAAQSMRNQAIRSGVGRLAMEDLLNYAGMTGSGRPDVEVCRFQVQLLCRPMSIMFPDGRCDLASPAARKVFRRFLDRFMAVLRVEPDFHYRAWAVENGYSRFLELVVENNRGGGRESSTES